MAGRRRLVGLLQKIPKAHRRHDADRSKRSLLWPARTQSFPPGAIHEEVEVLRLCGKLLIACSPTHQHFPQSKVAKRGRPAEPEWFQGRKLRMVTAASTLHNSPCLAVRRAVYPLDCILYRPTSSLLSSHGSFRQIEGKVLPE